MATIISEESTIIGRDEMERFAEAMKDVRFRELLQQYAEEISDPETLRRYEEELCLLEKERGYEATFVYPEGGYVLKTSVAAASADHEVGLQQIAFINIAKNIHVEKPSCSRSDQSDFKGLNWTVPYLLSPPREDADESGQKCYVYDVIFNPDTLYMASKNIQFCKMIEETAVDGVEERFSVKLDRENISYPKFAFKGQAVPTIIRKPVARTCNSSDDTVPADMETYLSNKLNQTYLSEKSSEDLVYNNNKTELDSNCPATPKYSVKYRQAVRLDDYNVISRKSANIRPTEVVIDVHLPKIDCASQLNLDVLNQTLSLTSRVPNPAYSLKVNLTFPVDDRNGNAQFDKTTKHLIITLPVIPYKTPEEIFRDSPQPKVCKCFDENETQNLHNCNFNSSKSSGAMDNYKPPPFHFNQSNDSVAIVVDIPNIVRSSVELHCCECGKGVKLEFWSTAPKQEYMLCLRFNPYCSIEPSSGSFDVSDENLVMKFRKSSPGVWNTFSSSTSGGQDWIENSFLTRETVLGHLENLQKETDHSIENSRSLENIDVHVRSVSEEVVTVEVQVPQPDKSHLSEEKASTLSSSLSSEDGSQLSKPRNDSESSEDSMRQYRRGILKYPHNWRSISESSDDFSMSQDFLSSDPEWSGESLSDKSKKVVRFNDNISRNVFRPNSSILGQKRKNQKRSQQKKKSDTRKRNSGSESEPSEIGDSAEGFSSMSESELGTDELVGDKTWTGLSPISEKTSPAEIPKKEGACKEVPHKTLDFRTSENLSQDATNAENKTSEAGFHQSLIDLHGTKNVKDKILDFRTSGSVKPDVQHDQYKKATSSVNSTKKPDTPCLDFSTSKEENEEMLDFRTSVSANLDSTYDGSKKFDQENKKFRTSSRNRRKCNTKETPVEFRTDNQQNANGIDFRTSKRPAKGQESEKSSRFAKSNLSREDEKDPSKSARKKKKGRRTFSEVLDNGQEGASVFAMEESDMNDGWMEIKPKHKRKIKGTQKKMLLNKNTTVSEVNYDADEQSPSPDSYTKRIEFKMNGNKREEKDSNDGDVIESTTAPAISDGPQCCNLSFEGSEFDFSNVMFELD